MKTIRIARAALAIAAGLFGAARSHAQAWVPPKGEGAIGFGYQNIYVRDHLFAGGQALEAGTIRTNNYVLDLSYGLTDSLAFSFSIPYVSARYDGPVPHTLPNDDGRYHGAFADYRFELRMNVLQRPFFLTPLVAVVIPSHDYTYFAHTAPSRGLHEYQVGLNVGRRLDPIVPNGVIHASYTFAYVEKVLDVSHNRSNVDIELGYFLTPSLTLKGVALYQRTHGGLELALPGTPEGDAFVNTIYWTHHDQLGRENYWKVGPAVDYALTGALSVYGGYIWTVWGENGHSVRSGILLGASCSFSPEQMARRIWHVVHPIPAR